MKELSFADTLLAELGAWEEASTSIMSSHTLPPQQASFAPSLENVQQVLPAGIGQLYSHQAVVLERALRGEHVTLATPTASGKTLALTLPSLIKRATYREGTVMCIAPTRALVEQWTKLVQEWQPSLQVASYTGDTPKHERRKIRERIQFLVTTPDMLHMGILPYHAGWHRFLSHLEDVYIDPAAPG